MKSVLTKVKSMYQKLFNQYIKNPHQKKEEQLIKEQLIFEIREVCVEMENLEQKFQMVSDSDLIDSCIYQLEALRARYRYLMRLAKETGLSNQPFAVPKYDYAAQLYA